MSLRLISKSVKTPVAFVNGVPVYRVFGAEGEGNDSGSGDTGDSGDSGDKGKEGTDTGSEGGDDAKGKDAVISKEEYDKVQARMQAADKRAADLEKKVKEFEDKDKSELEKAQSDLKTAQDTLAEKDKVILDLRFENAFALKTKYSWHDPEVVLGILRKRDDVEIKEDGTIEGLDKALDAIAKDKPFLVKKEDDDDGGDGKGSASGSGTGSGRRGDQKIADEDKLRSKYKALNV